MTGTSVDGLDIALLLDEPKPRVLSAQTVSLPETLRIDLLHLVHDDSHASIDLLGHCDVALGRFIGQSVMDFLNVRKIETKAVTAIGSHGQTVRHRPFGENAFTLQIGDAHQIAEITGIDTVADFRRRDVAAGGQGAPLVPAFHRAVFSDTNESRVILNIGGIANITRLAPREMLTGFDTGPGNALLDLWIQHQRGLALDKDGAWASQGEVNEPLLTKALRDPYFKQAPPKSTGREYFNHTWLSELLNTINVEVSPESVQTTLVEFTARSIIDAIDGAFNVTDRVIVCGGGRRNSFLLSRLRNMARCPVDISEDWSVDGDSLEAGAFAWMAARTISGEASGVPSVTGAKAPRVLGVIHPASA
jgi:anhydro-N-acetylmuramic acid kinase